MAIGQIRDQVVKFSHKYSQKITFIHTTGYYRIHFRHNAKVLINHLN